MKVSCFFKVEYHDDEVNEFIREHGKAYAALKLVHSNDNVKEWQARDLAS